MEENNLEPIQYSLREFEEEVTRLSNEIIELLEGHQKREASYTKNFWEHEKEEKNGRG